MNSQENMEKTITDKVEKKDEEVNKEEKKEQITTLITTKNECTEKTKQVNNEEVRKKEEKQDVTVPISVIKKEECMENAEKDLTNEKEKKEEVLEVEGRKKKVARRKLPASGRVCEELRDEQSFSEIPSSSSSSTTSSAFENRENAEEEEGLTKKKDGAVPKQERRKFPGVGGVPDERFEMPEETPETQKPRHPDWCRCRGRSYGCPCYYPGFMVAAEERSRQRWPEAYRSEQEDFRREQAFLLAHTIWFEPIHHRLRAFDSGVPEEQLDHSPVICHCNCGRDAWPDELQMHKARRSERQPVSQLHPPVEPLPPVQPQLPILPWDAGMAAYLLAMYPGNVLREQHESILSTDEAKCFVRMLNAAIRNEPFENRDEQFVESFKAARRCDSEAGWPDLITSFHRHIISQAGRMPRHGPIEYVPWISVSPLKLEDISARVKAIRRLVPDGVRIKPMEIYYMLCYANFLWPVERRKPMRGDTAYTPEDIRDVIGFRDDQEKVEGMRAFLEKREQDRQSFLEQCQRRAFDFMNWLVKKHKNLMGTPKPRHVFNRRPVFAKSDDQLEAMRWFRDLMIIEVKREEVRPTLPVPPGSKVEEPIAPLEMSFPELLTAVFSDLQYRPSESHPSIRFPPFTPQQSSQPISSHPVVSVEHPETESESNARDKPDQ